jgi:FtsZ-binding cell division protein ZapB
MNAAWTIGIVVTVALTAMGWLLTRNYALNQIIATQRETIDTLRRQVDRLEITAELTDKIMSQLPKEIKNKSAHRERLAQRAEQHLREDSFGQAFHRALGGRA